MSGKALLGRFGQALIVVVLAFTLAFVLLRAPRGRGADWVREPWSWALPRPDRGHPRRLRRRHALVAGLPAHPGRVRRRRPRILHPERDRRGAAGRGGAANRRLVSLAAAVVLALAIAFAATWTPLPWLRNALASLPSVFVSVPAVL